MAVHCAFSPQSSYLADPAGVVVGKFTSRHFPAQNKPWLGTKTVCGSFAVFLATYICLHAPHSPVPRLLVSAFAALGEAVGGAYDNLLIALVVVVASGVVM
jgi:dolichol kinase